MGGVVTLAGTLILYLQENVGSFTFCKDHFENGL